MADGTIDPLFEEILLEMGQWLQVNGEAIYDSIPWTHQNDTPAQDIWYTASEVSLKMHYSELLLIIGLAKCVCHFIQGINSR